MASWWKYSHVIVTSNERYGVSKHRLLDYLFNSFSSLTTKETSKLRIIESLWRNPHVPGGFPSQRVSNAVKSPCHDVIINNRDFHRAQSVDVTLPAGYTCENCTIRLLRQASEWSRRYRFWSCADVRIIAGAFYILKWIPVILRLIFLKYSQVIRHGTSIVSFNICPIVYLSCPRFSNIVFNCTEL